jgi:hypothetical protein
MRQITYLLGAGASYQCLPVVDEMHDRIGAAMGWFIAQFNKAYPSFSQNGEIFRPKEYEKLDKINSDLAWLMNICNTKKNFSVDTFARKLKMSGKIDEYEKLKNILSFYFIIEQKRNLPDVRYDNFWASILKSKLEFPDNIKIISWNYDFQLELTYQGFLGTDSLQTARKTLNVSSLESFSFGEPDCFGIFKLNGSATFSSESVKKPNYWVDNFNDIEIDEFIKSVIESYERLQNNSMISNISNHLSFAWEHQDKEPFYAHLKKAIGDTEILVVIGYSFPFFNRDIDKLILKDFMGDRLRKVYFQAPDAEDLRERFLAINNDESIQLVLRKDIKQFTLPNEL